jgi:transcriptional regulator with XRE-family HTH domain
MASSATRAYRVGVTQTTFTEPTVGKLLRDWRTRRHLSQIALASDAAVSTRYLSFIETGRARPSREMVLHLAEELQVPLRERNGLLMAAGYAPFFPHRSLDDGEMAPVREALDHFLKAHLPYPAAAVDGHWNMVAANEGISLLTQGVASELLDPPANVFRIALHPDGMAPRILNFPEWSGSILARVGRQAGLTGDPALQDLYDELSRYPGVSTERHVDGSEPVLMHRLRLADEELTFFSTVTTFGTPTDITLAELTLEAFYPADTKTKDFLSATT